MPPLSAYQRFQRTLHALFRKPSPFSKGGLARYCGKQSPSWVSNLLNPRSKDPQLTLDDLTNIAGYFRISVDELLGVPKRSELTGDEARVLFGFRALPDVTRTHFLAIVEAASLGAHLAPPTRHFPLAKGLHLSKTTGTSLEGSQGGGRSVPSAPDDELRIAVRTVIVALSFALQSSETADRADHGPGPHEATRG